MFFEDPDSAVRSCLAANGQDAGTTFRSTEETVQAIKELAMKETGRVRPFDATVEFGYPTRIVVIWADFQVMLGTRHQQALKAEASLGSGSGTSGPMPAREFERLMSEQSLRNTMQRVGLTPTHYSDGVPHYVAQLW